MNNLFIIKLGGSLVVPEANRFDKEYLEQLREVLSEFINQGHHFVIIVGGGAICRWYQNEAMRLSVAGNVDLNWIGAYVTRVNAELVNAFFRPLSHKGIYYQFDQEIKIEKPILTVGAWKPGTSTNMDAVRMAEKFGSKIIINLSNTDYVYDKNPHKFSDAKPLTKISWGEYEKIIEWRTTKYKGEHKAGDHLPFDPIATKKAKELGLQVIFINGRNLTNLAKALKREDFIGTRIGEDKIQKSKVKTIT